jgi:hypothetical protein
MKRLDREMTSNNFVPFYANSVNLLSSTTNGGKTTFLLNVLKHREIYFSCPVEGVIVVMCNPVVEGDVYKDLETDHFPIEIVYFENFEADHLKENFVVIFEDVSIVSQIIFDVINVYTHHLNLSSVFVVCQSVFKDKFKELLSITHNVIFSFSGANGVRLAKYINHYFCAGDDLKKYLTEITNLSSTLNSLVLLQINPIARKDRPTYYAIVGIENLYKDDDEHLTLVFPQLGSEIMYKTMYEDNETELENVDGESFPNNTFVLVPMKNVKKKTNSSEKSPTSVEQKWQYLNENLKEEILNMFTHTKKQRPALLIASKMLKNKDFSFSKDGSQVMIKSKPNTQISTLDFLDLASRPSFPNEPPKPKQNVYSQFARKLIENGAPESIIKNKALLYKPKKMLYKKKNFE